MICVTKIEVLEVPDNHYELARRNHKMIPVIKDGEETYKDHTYVREVIQGRKFCKDGEMFVIGWSCDVFNALSLPLDVFEIQRDEIEIFRRVVDRNNKTIQEINNRGFWKIIFDYFKGVKYQ